jgi:diadenosine tetraphosphate (Ap4A) HIT family hydrolase
MTANACPLCCTDGGALVYRHPKFRVIEANESQYPGFLRLIWNAHVREFSALSRDDRTLCMDVMVELELFLLETFQPTKVNVASLGNVVPHLHWHVIPRFEDDAHFPAPVWANSKEGVGLSSQQEAIRSSKAVWMADLAHRLEQQFPGTP